MNSSVLALAEDKGFLNELAQVRAKAVLIEVVGEAPQYKWTYVAPRLVRNIIAALHQIEQISASEPSRLGKYASVALRSAQAWESLARLQERTNRETALVNAAAAYELAGYQANASCLARQLAPPQHLLSRPTLVDLSAVFLQRLFLQARALAQILQKEPPGDLGPLLREAAIALAAQGIATAAQYFLGGEDGYIEEASKLLQLSVDGFASLGLVRELNLATTLRSLLPVMKRRSIWTVLRTESDSSKLWERYLKLLARGFGQDVFKSPSVSELWPSQLRALEQGLLTSGSKIVRMPTSAGKTRVAELAIAHTLVTGKAKCIYIAPYKALVTEMQQTFLHLFADMGFQVSSILGSYESDDFEQLLAEDADMLVVTPEKLDLLLRLRPDFLSSTKLIILDEGHLIQERGRGTKLELLLTRIRRRFPSARFIILSAVVPQETLQDFAAWMKSGERGIIQSDWRASIQKFAFFHWTDTSGTIRYIPLDESTEHLKNHFVPGIIQQQVFEYVDPTSARTRRRRFPDTANKSHTAAELAFKYADTGPVLVFCSQTNFAESVGNALLQRIRLAELTREPVSSHFRTPNTRAAIVAAEWLGEEHPITQSLRSGIAIHHGGLPDVLRKAVESDFREGSYRVIAATNTLAQGVNLPIRTAIVHSCWRGDVEARSRINARDYWNIAGRAGRARHETEGTIIHLVFSERDLEDMRYYLNSRTSLDPVESGLFQILRDVANARLSDLAAIEALDPEILALLVEESDAFATDEAIEKLLADSLASVQAKRHKIPIEPLRNVVRRASTEILRNTPDAEYRLLYSSTGLRTQSCEALRLFAKEKSDEMKRLMLMSGPEQRRELGQMFLNGCLRVEEMQPTGSFAGDYLELMDRWLGGVHISLLRTEFAQDEKTAEELPKFIEDLFGYKLPWGISGQIRIACKVLQISPQDVSTFCKFFPSLLKFGVPFAEAAWAMTLGIPFRDVAIRIASRYLSEEKSSSYQSFAEWIGGLMSDDLRTEYGLRSPILEDVSRSLTLTGRNPLLRDFAGIDSLLPMGVQVQGIGYEGRAQVALQVREGLSLRILRDYDNPVDRNAVLVSLDGQTLGYLPKRAGQLLAPEIDTGLDLGATVVSVARVPFPVVTIRLQRAG